MVEMPLKQNKNDGALFMTVLFKTSQKMSVIPSPEATATSPFENSHLEIERFNFEMRVTVALGPSFKTLVYT